jgi:PAS domain S-box-containing protein
MQLYRRKDMPGPLYTDRKKASRRCVIGRGVCSFVVVLVLTLLLSSPTPPCVATTTPRDLLVLANLYEPFVFRRGDALVGFDIDLINLISSLNSWTVRYQVVSFAEELDSIERGTADIGAGSIFWTQARAERFAYSDSYLTSGLVIATLDGSPIHNAEGLRGRTVAVKSGTASDDYVSALNADQDYAIKITRYATSDPVFEALVDKSADAVVHDALNARATINRTYAGQIIMLPGTALNPYLTGYRPLAFPFGSGAADLLPAFNKTLSDLRRSGILAQLENKWFGTATRPDPGVIVRTVLLMLAGVVCVVAVVLVSSRRMRTIRSGRERSSLYQDLFAAIPEPAFLVRSVEGQLTIEAVNVALCRLLDRRESDLVLKPLTAVVLAAEGGTPQNLSSLLDRSTTTSHWQFSASDGTPIPVEIKTSALHGSHGRLIIVAWDQRERIKAEQTVRSAYEQYHSLFDDAPDPVFIFDGYAVLTSNRAAAAALGLTTSQLAGKRLKDISPSAQPDGTPSDAAARAHADAAAAGETQRFEWVFLSSSGDEVICTASLQSMHAAGPPVLQGIFHDITDKRRSEQRNQMLEHQLFDAQKMEAVGRLAGGIAHDFNNILGGILGYASLLRVDAQPDSGLYEGLNIIEAAARRAAGLTHRLLSFSRHDAPRRSDVDMGSLISDTLSITMPGFDRRVALEQRLAPDLDYVSGDQTQLEEAVLNLVVNAKDAMRTGGTLTVSAENLSVDEEYAAANIAAGLSVGRFVRIIVADTGTGLTPEAEKHLFEPFFTTRPDGTGLGLSIVWRVVHDHGGHITVESAAGKGTTFTMYFPATPRLTGQVHSRSSAEPSSLPHAQHHETILIVDDEDVVRTVAVKMLGGLDYTTLDCADPLDALALYRKDWQSIDLVLLDIMMPHMNGRDLLIQMRSINPLARVILLSGYDETTSAAETDGITAFVAKPYTLLQLSARVFQMLNDPLPAPPSSGASEADRT